MGAERQRIPDPGQGRQDPDHKPQSEIPKRKSREKGMDKTLADSYPASDPPSTIPNPGGEEQP